MDPARPEATGLEFTVLERPVRVLCRGPLGSAFADAALTAFVDLDGRRAHASRADLVVETADRDLPGLLEELAQRLCQWAIHARREDLLMFHAFGVADPVSGASVAFVGRSGAGKSTAASILARHWSYLSDEVVALRGDGGVVPLPKPLSLITDAHAAKAQVPRASLDLLPPPEAPRLAGLVLLDRQPGAQLSVARVGTIDALPLLAPQVSYLGCHVRPLRRLVQAIEHAGGVRRATYGEAAQLGGLVRELVAGATR